MGQGGGTPGSIVVQVPASCPHYTPARKSMQFAPNRRAFLLRDYSQNLFYCELRIHASRNMQKRAHGPRALSGARNDIHRIVAHVRPRVPACSHHGRQRDLPSQHDRGRRSPVYRARRSRNVFHCVHRPVFNPNLPPARTLPESEDVCRLELRDLPEKLRPVEAHRKHNRSDTSHFR